MKFKLIIFYEWAAGTCSFLQVWMKSHTDLVCKPCILAYKLSPHALVTDEMSQYMTQTASDGVDLHSHEKNLEPSLAL